jgi:hypothetical protein
VVEKRGGKEERGGVGGCRPAMAAAAHSRQEREEEGEEPLDC